MGTTNALVYRELLFLLFFYLTDAQFSYIPDTVYVPHIHTTDYPVWNNVKATCKVTMTVHEDHDPQPRELTYSATCNRCEVFSNASDILYEKDKNIIKKPCAISRCSNSCPGVNCIPPGEIMTVGVRCWHTLDQANWEITATFDIISVATSNSSDCREVSVSNGYLSSDQTAHCTSLSVTCEAGYSLSGESSLSCCNGTWTATTPSCYKDCQPLSVPSGRTYTNHTNHGDEVVIVCDDGYSLTGSTKLACSNGDWSDDIPVCHKDCQTLNMPNGDLSSNQTTHGSQVDIVCNANYSLLGATPVRCLDGVWSGNKPVCYRECLNNRYGENCSIPCDCETNNTVAQEQSCHPFSGKCRCMPSWRGERCTESIQYHDDADTNKLILPLGIGFGLFACLLVVTIVIVGYWRRVKKRKSNRSKEKARVSVVDIFPSRQNRPSIPREDSNGHSEYCTISYNNPLNRNVPTTSQENAKSSLHQKKGIQYV